MVLCELQPRRNASRELVVGEVQRCQVAQVDQLRRYLPAQLVFGEVQSEDAAVDVYIDAMPLA